MKQEIYELCKGKAFVTTCYEYNNANCNHTCNYAIEKDKKSKEFGKTIKEIIRKVESNRIRRGIEFVCSEKG